MRRSMLIKSMASWVARAHRGEYSASRMMKVPQGPPATHTAYARRDHCGGIVMATFAEDPAGMNSEYIDRSAGVKHSMDKDGNQSQAPVRKN